MPIKKILVATDFSETSENAVNYAIDLARQLKAAVVIVHTYELPVYGFPDGSIIATPEMAVKITDAAQTALDALGERHRSDGLDVTTMLRDGAPAEEVSAIADDIDADLIVVGTHGRRGIARAVLGSVTEHLIRLSHRPVLAVHLPAKPKS